MLTSRHITRTISASHLVSPPCFNILEKTIDNVAVFHHHYTWSTAGSKNWFGVRVSPVSVILNPDLGCFL
jgi:hypothetical protein